MKLESIMGANTSVHLCNFDILFENYVPHILEKIFLSLDYQSYVRCMTVSSTWKNLLTSESYQRRARALFRVELLKEEQELWKAAEKGQSKRIRSLLSNGILNINCMLGDNGTTPLHEAVTAMWIYGCYKKDTSSVKLLLERGADPNIIDQLNRTPLCEAALFGTKAAVKVLLDRGAEPNKQTGYYRGTPLHVAAQRGDKDIVIMLLNAGADPNLRDRHGETPLHTVHRYCGATKFRCNRGIMQDLLTAGADPTIIDDWGNTPVISMCTHT